MERLFIRKEKIYSCKDSIIFYQKAQNEIAFLIDEAATGKIAEWEKETIYSDEEIKVLQGAADGSPSYNLMIFVADNHEVNLWIQKSFNYIFNGVFQGQESNSLIDLDSTPCPQVIREPQRVVLKIEGAVYQTLINWESWVDVEAFAGRYTYRFYENATFDQKFITVSDTVTGKNLVLDDSDSLWDR